MNTRSSGCKHTLKVQNIISHKTNCLQCNKTGSLIYTILCAHCVTRRAYSLAVIQEGATYYTCDTCGKNTVDNKAEPLREDVW